MLAEGPRAVAKIDAVVLIIFRVFLHSSKNMSNTHLGDRKASWIGTGWQWDGKLVCKEPSD